jgi:hypothetical protein
MVTQVQLCEGQACRERDMQRRRATLCKNVHSTLWVVMPHNRLLGPAIIFKQAYQLHPVAEEAERPTHLACLLLAQVGEGAAPSRLQAHHLAHPAYEAENATSQDGSPGRRTSTRDHNFQTNCVTTGAVSELQCGLGPKVHSDATCGSLRVS